MGQVYHIVKHPPAQSASWLAATSPCCCASADLWYGVVGKCGFTTGNGTDYQIFDAGEQSYGAFAHDLSTSLASCKLYLAIVIVVDAQLLLCSSMCLHICVIPDM